MKQVLKYTGYIALVALTAFLIWRFWFMIAWVMVAAIISFLGKPLVNFFDRLHIRKLALPHPLAALLALLSIVLMFLALIAVFVPLIFDQAQTISQIDVNLLAQNLRGPLHWLEVNLQGLGIIPSGVPIQDYIVNNAKSVVNLGNVTTFIRDVFSAAGSIFIGLFSILFISFFFLKDEALFEETLLLLVPEKYLESTHKVLVESRNLLRRYFGGIIIELLCVMTIISVFLWIFGIKNALLIGFFGGIMNIIPYLGPVIGTTIGITLGMTASLASGSYSDLLPIFLKLLGVFLGANFIDNNFLVPFIYSSSVKAHPLEIFFIIIIGGSLAGIVGMLLAVPTYTVLRVIGREFFHQNRIIKKLTEKIDQDS
jgi:predicted PurR-regulated permease PerM